MRSVLKLAFILLASLALVACESSEERAEKHYQNAISLIAEGDKDRAIVELRNVFDLNGSHQEARHLIAELILEHRNNPQGAYSQYLRLAEQYPDDLRARVALAQLAFRSGNFEELDRHASEAERIAPSDPEVEVLGIIREYRDAIVNDDPTQREGVASRAAGKIESDPSNLFLREIVFDDDIRNNEYSAALVHLDLLTQQVPDEKRYWRQRLQVLIQLGDEEGTEAQLIDLIDRFPEDVEQKASLVRYYIARGRTEDLENFLRKLADEAPADELGPRLDLIRFTLEVHGPVKAQEELVKAIAAADNPTPFLVLNASIDFTAGRSVEAITALETILETAEPSEDTDNVRVTLAKMLLETGNEVGARSLVEIVLADNPSQVSAMKMNARWLIDADDADSAISSLRLALDTDPDDAEALTLMAEAYTRIGSRDLAREFLTLAVEASNNAPTETVRLVRLLISEERYLQAEDLLLDALRLAPDNLALIAVTAELYLAMEDLGRVQQVVTTLERLDSAEAREMAVQIEAQRLNQQSGVEDALAYLEGVAGQSDSNIATQVMLIRARLSTGELDGAASMAEELLQEAPEDPRLKLIVATTAASVGDLDRAETMYRSVLTEFPNEAGIWVQLSRLKLRQGEPDAARAVVDEALEAAPDDPRVLWALASFHEQDGDIDGAIEIYERLYEQDTSSVIVANNLASLITTYRDDPESLDRAWNIARRFRDTEIPAVQDTYGWIAHRRGDSADALPYLESAATALPNDALVQFHYAEVLNALERTADALAQYRTVVEVAGVTDTRPQMSIARDKIRELEALIAAE